MKLQVHEFLDDNFCKWCGQINVPDLQTTCLQRDIPPDARMPEPKRREYACEAFDEIRARLAEVEKESLPQ